MVAENNVEPMDTNENRSPTKKTQEKENSETVSF